MNLPEVELNPFHDYDEAGQLSALNESNANIAFASGNYSMFDQNLSMRQDDDP